MNFKNIHKWLGHGDINGINTKNFLPDELSVFPLG